MADATKAQRLAAAKKKVKEYQKSRKVKTESDTKTPPIGSLTDSTHSSLNETQTLDEPNETYKEVIHSASPLQQYFSGGNSGIFDEIGSNSHNDDFYKFDVINYTNANDTENQKEEEIKFAQVNLPDTNDAVAIEDPEIEPNEIYNRLNKLNQENRDHTMENVTHLKDDTDNVQQNMQSLKQLSSQIIQMIDDNNQSTKMEHKDGKVYEYLQAEQEKCKRLYDEGIFYRNHIAELENESQTFKARDEKHERDIKQLSDKIEFYQQTIDILVSEKSELSDLLSQSETNSKRKNSECEELTARLKASRSRVADLEKELNLLRAEKQDKRFEDQQSEYHKLQGEHKSLQNQYEETLQDVSELRSKLNGSNEDNAKLKGEVQDLTSQLSLLNIKLQQLSTGIDQQQFTGHIEGLTQQINVFEKQVFDLNNVVKALSIEKEQTSLQYQQYVQQLNGQLSDLVQKLEEKSRENETLIGREQELTRQMAEFEKLLQKLQNERQVGVSNGGSSNKENEEALKSLTILQDEKALLEENYQLVISERDEAFKDLQLRKEEITQLEEEINMLQSNQPDNAKLLAEIESDKVAASRAVAQNNELKKQLDEMQHAFIQMSNNKLELTELLNEQQHKNKELNDKLNQFESQVHTLASAIETKDREMVMLRENAQELDKYVLQQNQLEDRLRHYEAHDHSTHALQHELQESYKRIQNLRSENETLKFHLKNAEDKNKKAEDAKNEGNAANEDKSILLGKIKELENRNKTMEEKLLQSPDTKQIQDEEPVNVTTEIKPTGDINQQVAMKQLEEKFTKTMKEIADLKDEKQRLEHLVMQLQYETETIGEYVTLYQHQRGVLKQRALEREEQMQQLTVDREHMKIKIDRLNELIKGLLLEKGSISPEFLDKHLAKQQLCAEHARTLQNGINNNNTTAEKIIELLTDIKSSNLVQPPSEISEHFHLCPSCSGQLITV